MPPCNRLLQASVGVNILLVVLLAFVLRRPTPQPGKVVADLTDKNEKSLQDLRQQVQALNDERTRALADFEEKMRRVAADHAKEIADIEARKSGAAASILKTYDNNIPGLAREFSRTMGL